MKHWGIINGKNKQFSLSETLTLIDLLEHWQANLFIWWVLSWGETIRPMDDIHFYKFKLIQKKCKEKGITFWAGMKPGDQRYCKNKKDRKLFIQNAVKYIDNGADGFYLAMDDLHPKRLKKPFGHIRAEDSIYHAKLICELQNKLGSKLKAICAEQYHGLSFKDYKGYWSPIFESLHPETMITWTGPKTWNRKLTKEHFSWIKRPVMLFDNFIANNSSILGQTPVYPYSGRDHSLTKAIDAAVINPNKNFQWQYWALYTAMDYFKNSKEYDSDISFSKAVMEFENIYQKYYLKIKNQGVKRSNDATNIKYLEDVVYI